jgi:hypothetical protein
MASVRPGWIIAVAVLARTLVLAVDPPARGLERLEHSTIAANINAGRGYVFEQYGTAYRAWKEPLSIVLLAGVTRVAGADRTWPVLLMQGCFSAMAAVGVAMIAFDLWRESRRAMFAGMVAAANPFLVYYDTHFIYPLGLDACLFVVTLRTILHAARPQASLRSAAWAGVAMGVTLWERAIFIAAGAGAWTVAVVTMSPRARVLRAAAVWAIVSAAVIAPWFLRNYRIFGRLILTTDAAHVLWLGNNPLSNGTYGDDKGRRVFYLADREFQEQIIRAPELDQHDRFLGAARAFIREQPGRFLQLFLTRIRSFFWFSPTAGIIYSAAERTTYRVAYVALLVCAVAGAVGGWRAADLEARCAMKVMAGAVIGLAAAHGLTALNLKHRVPLELVLSVFAGFGLAGLHASRITPAASRAEP